MTGRRFRGLNLVWIKFPEPVRPKPSTSLLKQTRSTDKGCFRAHGPFEYQAKELFAKHHVPTTPGRVTDSAEDAKAIAEEIGKPVMVKAQVKVGGRGKAGGVKYAATPDDAFTHAQNILGPTSRVTSSRSCWSPRPAISPRSTTSPSCSIVPTAPISRCARSRAAWRSKRSRRPSPSGSPRCPSTPSRVSTWPPPARSPSRATCRPRCSTRPQ